MTSPAPVVDLPLRVAVEEMTGFEVIAIEDHFGKDLQALGAMKTLIGAVFIYGNRNSRKMAWKDATGMTLKQMQAYFAPEPEEAVEDEPVTDLGKES